MIERSIQGVFLKSVMSGAGVHDGRRRPVSAGLACLILICCGLVVAIVYWTGGTRYVYAHSAYLPIILAATRYGAWGGVATGVLMGLLLGPAMPLDVATGEMQQPQNWIVRAMIFAAAGGLLGLWADKIKAAARERESAAWVDSATGFLNRNALEQALRRVMEDRGELDEREDASDKASLTVIRFNSLFAAGQVLGVDSLGILWRQIAERARKAVNPGDEVYRVHADQLAVLRLDTNAPNAVDLARELVGLLGEPFSVNGIPVTVDPSAGVVAIVPGQGQGKDSGLSDIFNATNAALFASESGAMIETKGASTIADTRRSLSLLGQLSGAIRRGELELHYQPKVCLTTRTLAGAEALVRWRHPREGLLMPGAFMPEVEKTGLIDALTWFVLATACREARGWRELGVTQPVAVNISGRNLADSEFSGRVMQVLSEERLPPECLEIEVTEGAVMFAPQRARQALSDLREAGVTVALDDFGTGHSSLAYLADLPASSLKIDRAFVKDLHGGGKAAAIVGAIIDLAHRLDLKTIAEGVEDEGTLDILAEIGCGQAQGYYLSRPIDAEAFMSKWIATHR